MAVKTFGTLVREDGEWLMKDVKPHVCIKLKSVFPKIPKHKTSPFHFKDTPETCSDLLWFIDRYPMAMSAPDAEFLVRGKHKFDQTAREIEEIMVESRVPKEVKLNDGETARKYQLQAAELHSKTKRILLGDDLGLGKTLSAILTLSNPGTLPAIIVVQTHLTRQWKAEIEKFTNLKTHIIKVTQPYSLPASDVYIIKYSCICGWVNLLTNGTFKSVIFDEVQELRLNSSNKYRAGKAIADSVDFTVGLSATPVYNYGNEIWNILDLLKPGCLGDFVDFTREWASWSGRHWIINDPHALGAYLRDNYLFLRRTRADVSMELPAINKIVHYVDYDHKEASKIENLAQQLAMRIMHGSFVERGSAARELDLLVRQQTGVSKAKEVAEYVKILVSNGEPVVLAGWHREVYEIWKEVLAEFNPVFYTGTESESQKAKAKEAFVNGETNLFIISLRSGIGLDGLQKRCHTVVIGELDWSPKVHEQLIGRVDRPGQGEQVTAIYLVTDYGSDPVIIDLLGLKSSQAHAIVDPMTSPIANVSDDSRIKKLAEMFLYKKRQN